MELAYSVTFIRQVLNATQQEIRNREKHRLCQKRYVNRHPKKYEQSQKKYRESKRGYLNHVFTNMLYRCNNPKHKSYKYYGARGIQVIFASFDAFYNYVLNELDVDPRGLTIDRIDNDRNYEPGNIRFISQAENLRNRNRS